MATVGTRYRARGARGARAGPRAPHAPGGHSSYHVMFHFQPCLYSCRDGVSQVSLLLLYIVCASTVLHVKITPNTIASTVLVLYRNYQCQLRYRIYLKSSAQGGGLSKCISNRWRRGSGIDHGDYWRSDCPTPEPPSTTRNTYSCTNTQYYS